MSGDANVWLYAVVEAERPPPSGLRGVAGEAVQLISGPEVAAVAGLVPRADFDREPLEDHLDDTAWLARTARAHHQVIEALAQHGPCLPMRLATLYRDERRAAEMLQARGEELLKALGDIAGRSEWGVKVYAARPAATTSAAGEQTAVDETSPGTAYLLRRKAQNAQREDALRQAMDEAQQIHASLADVVDAAAQHAPQGAEISGRAEPMVLNGSYLVDDSQTAAFDEAVTALAAGHPELRVEVTGPWPAYSFSGVGTESAGLAEGAESAESAEPEERER